MTTPLTVLDGFDVQVHPGDKYLAAHLFLRSTYVHRILITDAGALLIEAAQFDGTRTTFTPEEVDQLRELEAKIKGEEQARLTQKKARQAQAAAQVIRSHETKLAGMDETKIYD